MTMPPSPRVNATRRAAPTESDAQLLSQALTNLTNAVHGSSLEGAYAGNSDPVCCVDSGVKSY
jgi:hypothetical protein